MDVGENTTLGNGHTSQQLVEFLVIADGELHRAGGAAVLLVVAGGVAGQALERRVTEKKGLEITVKLDNGELRAITQEADEVFRPGERVRLLSGTGVTRVTH